MLRTAGINSHAGAGGEARLTWSLSALVQAEYLVLHICGKSKWEVLQQALEPFQEAERATSGNTFELPVSAVLDHTSQTRDSGTPLDIYFAETC